MSDLLIVIVLLMIVGYYVYEIETSQQTVWEDTFEDSDEEYDSFHEKLYNTL